MNLLMYYCHVKGISSHNENDKSVNVSILSWKIEKKKKILHEIKVSMLSLFSVFFFLQITMHIHETFIRM